MARVLRGLPGRTRGTDLYGFYGADVGEIKLCVMLRKMKLWDHMHSVCTSMFLKKICLLFQVVVYYKYVCIHIDIYIKSQKKLSCFYNIDLSVVIKNPTLNNKYHTQYKVF